MGILYFPLNFFSKSKTAPKLYINFKANILENPPCKNNHFSVIKFSFSFPWKYIYVCSEPLLSKGMPIFKSFNTKGQTPGNISALPPAPWATLELPPGSQGTTSLLCLFYSLYSHSKWQVLRDVWLAACCTWLCREGSGDGVHLGFSLWTPGLAVSADFSWRESEWRPRGAQGRWVLAFCQD